MVLARRPGAVITLPPAVRGFLLSGLAILLLAAKQGGFFPPAWRFGIAAFAAIVILQRLWTRSPRLTASLVALPAVLAALLAWSLLSATWSTEASVSLLDAQRTLLYLLAAVCFLLAGEGLAIGVAGGATVVAGWALLERVLNGPSTDPFEGHLLTGPLGYANALGALAAIGAVTTVALALDAHGRARWLAFAPLVVLVPALGLTNSRGAWAAAGLGLAITAAVHLHRRRVAATLLVLSAALVTILLIAPPSGVGERTSYWQVARAEIAAHPIEGTGAGTFRLDAAERGGTSGVRDAHSLYLQVFAELGIVGLALVLALVGLPLVLGLRADVAILGGFATFALHSAIDWDWQMPAVTVAGLALAAALLRETCRRQPVAHG